MADYIPIIYFYTNGWMRANFGYPTQYIECSVTTAWVFTKENNDLVVTLPTQMGKLFTPDIF